ncbi:hypothetical protein E4U60_002441 [Claviceps pazoutovae]|uniref:Uncharacterized protein n=1 Tax=Claviceps pazoutovae TaxID=1649127 RepID=A0A9P7SJQ5_9HYPO|nr:hypothetical protein E4U60_002441 [Claviceps pazoutovae]
MATESIICPPGYGYNDCEEDYSCSPWVFCSQIPATTSTARTLMSTIKSPEASSSLSSSSSSSSPSPAPAPAPSPSPSPARETDSGVTHTIPNSSLVTVTRHGVVFSKSPSATSPGLCSTCAPTSTFTSSPSTDVSERGSPSAGAIAGAATAAAIIIIIIIILSIGKSELILVFVLRRRKKRRGSCDTSEAETLGSDLGATGSEKLNSLKDAFSRMSKDPFAPFGGRVDKPDYPYRPSTGAFELDGVAITVVELPATSVPEVSNPVKTAATALDKASEPDTVKTATTAPDEASKADTVKTALDKASEPDTVKTATTAPDEASKADTVKTAPDEASEPDTVKTATTAPDEASKADTVKTAPDEASEPDTVTTALDKASELYTVKTATTAPDEASKADTLKTAPDEASEPDTVKTAMTAPDEASKADTLKTAPDEASEPDTAPPAPEPATTFASPSSPQGKITFVNQWKEYKAAAAGEAPG